MAFERFFSKASTRYSLLVFLFLISVFLTFALPHITYFHKATIQDPGPYVSRLVLRYVSNTHKPGIENFKVFIRKGWLPLKRFTFYTDSCIQQITFVGTSGETLKYPYEVDCTDHSPREIIVPALFQNKSFQMSFDLKLHSHMHSFRLQTFMGWPFISAFVVFISLTAFLLFALLRAEERSIRYSLPTAFVLYMTNFVVLDYDQWGYDAVGHLEHVKLVLSGMLIPKDICWECFQPPIAYWLAGLLYRGANEVLGLASATRILSVSFFLVFLYYGMKYLQLFCEKQKSSRALFGFLVVFLPSSIVHALRVGNDTIFYAFFMAALYYISRALIALKINFSDLKVFAWTSILALFTKATALVLYPFLVAVFAAKAIFYPRYRILIVKQWKRVLLALLPMLLALPLYFSMQSYKVEITKRLGTMNGLLRVKDAWVNRLGIDIVDYYSEPFTHPWKDEGGRQYFLNYYFKTASWAEFRWGNDVRNLALLWNYFCVFAFFYFLIGAYKKRILLKEIYLPLGAFFMCFSAALYYRFNYSFSSVQDFRFLFPILFPFGVIMLKISQAYPLKLVNGVLSLGGLILVSIWTVIFLR